MALSIRGKNAAVGGRPTLEALLRQEPYRFGFFQAIRVLSRMFPERQSVGYDVAPGSEIVRFHAHLSMHFPPSEICSLTVPEDSRQPAHLTVAFLGLTGPSGALPRYYTEQLLERARQKDHTLRDFLDLFNHRLLSLFYRAWEKNRFWTGFERAELIARHKLADEPRQYRSFVLYERARHDLFSQALLDLAGMGTGTLRYQATVEHELIGRTALSDETFRHYAGLLAQQHRSAIGLEGLLSDYFDLRVTVEQFSGQWLYLEPENQSCLTDDGNATLGMNVVVGERFWDLQGKFRIRLGPLKYQQFLDFLPPGTAFRPLAYLARLYGGQQFDIDVQAVLEAAEVPWCRLGDSGTDGARLGWNTWIRNNEFAHDATDAVFAVRDD